MTDFEKDIRDKFADHELYIDTDDIWPGIEKVLDKSAGRRRFLWWWFLPLLLLLLPIAYYMLAGRAGESIANQEVQSEVYSKLAENIEIEGPDFAQESLIVEHLPQEQERFASESLPTETGKKDIANAIIIPEEFNTSVNNEGDGTIDTEIISEKIANAENAMTLISTNSIQSDTDTPTLPAIYTEASTSGDNVTLETIKAIAFMKTGIRTLDSKPFILAIEGPVLPFESPDRKTNSWNRSLDIAIGYAFASKYLKPKDVSFIPYKELRKQTESHLEAITGAITYQFTHESGWFINSGLHYCQIDERFSSADSIYVLKYGEGLISTTLKPDGTIVENRGSKMIVEQRIWDKNIYNYYFFFDIPLNIGYAGSLKNLNYEISGGISYNISFLKKGQIFGVNSYPVEINKESGIFRTAGGLSLNSGLKLFLPFRQQLYYIEPNVRYNLNSIAAAGYPLQQNYLSYGINFGARMKF